LPKIDKDHKLMRDDGEIDWFALSVDFHNGPRCELCGTWWCDHCNTTIEPCKGE